MANVPDIVATPWKESSGICDCCGRASKTIWGDLATDESTLAVYYVSWTIAAPEHEPKIDLIVGPWGKGADPEHRILVSLLFRPAADGGSFMVVDANDGLSGYRTLCGHAMRREEVVGTPFGAEIFALVDALWVGDPRLSDVHALNHAA